jgi:hypothetical protein
MGKVNLGDKYSCLSSDLTSATDTIDRKLAVNLVSSYMEGLGIDSVGDGREFLAAVLDIVQAGREVRMPDGSVFHSRRGIPMGEPMAKGILGLFTACCDLVARKATNPVSHYFVAGGDDHLAIGPVHYLRAISSQFTKWGAILSPSKHGFSSLAVTYCEKTLLVANFKNCVSCRDLNSSTEAYLRSAFVDSVKVRLISPSSKANENFDSVNCAIGKGKSLARTLDWLNPDQYSHRWVSMIRNRFIYRMGSLLPRRSAVMYHLMLPERMGGLGLRVSEDLPTIFAKMPLATRVMFLLLREGRDYTRLFRALVSRSSIRGFELDRKHSEWEERLRSILPRLGCLTFRPLVAILREQGIIPDAIDDPRQIARILNRAGWYMEDDFIEEVSRPYQALQAYRTHCDLGHVQTAAFKKQDLCLRYKDIWSKLSELEPDFFTILTINKFALGYVEFLEQLNQRQPDTYWYNIEDLYDKDEFKNLSVALPSMRVDLLRKY